MAECQYAVLSDNALCVIMLDAMLSVIKKSAIMVKLVELNVVMPSVVMLNVVAPSRHLTILVSPSLVASSINHFYAGILEDPSKIS